MIDFDTYIKMGEPGGKERAEAWKTAIDIVATSQKGLSMTDM